MRIEDFKNPPVEYRPVPFLSVNDDLEEERFLKVAEDFLEKGWGGLFFHARVGLLTPYLGNRWFNLVRACVKRYRELGGRFWIYDENGWPSGQGGGQVSQRGPRFRSKVLLCSKATEGLPPAGTLRTESLALGGRMQRWHFSVRVMHQGCLPDLLEPEAVKAFLESTHALYKVHVGGAFGKTIPGVFTDEPQYATHHVLSSLKALPWTDRLPAEFEKDHGYSILDNLPSLFFDVGPYRKVRYHFFSTVTRLFLEAYSKQIYDWCEENGLKYTGHYEWEDSFLGQIHCVGSAMQHYEYMHYPGIDHLGRGLHNPWVEKQVASVASQLGKKRTLSETYGVAGQGLSFHDRRWIGNWQYALGINFLNHHLSLYSLRGPRKRDYPPTFSAHQPWWGYNSLVEDHFSRLSYLLSQGRRIVDVLVLSSIGSAWCEYSPSDASRVERIFDGFKAVTEHLLASQIDFEYGEEFIMARHASVRGGVLAVGKSRYKVVVLPPMGSLKRTTFELLKRFSDGGGAVICVGERPSMIEGEESAELATFVSTLPLVKNERASVCSAIKPSLSSAPSIAWVSGAPLDRLLIHRRRIGRAEIYFLVNTHYKETMRLEVDFGTDLQVLELETSSGRVLSCPSKTVIDLAGGEGRVFGVGLQASPEGGVRAAMGKPIAASPVRARWRISRESPNQCVLDFARWRVPGGRWSRLMPVWQVQDAVCSLSPGDEFEVRYEFEARHSGSLDLVLEDGHRFDVYVNGSKVDFDPHLWWLDPGFERMAISGRVVHGRNVVVLRARYDPDLSVEDAYLLGDFAVRVDGRRIPLLEDEDPVCEDLSDLRKAGYPFYAGAMRLEADVDIQAHAGRPYIEFDELGAIVSEFAVNGKELGKVFWREYRLDAGEAIAKGVNRISIRLVNSLRNLLGPRHWKKDEFTGVNPNSFRDAHGWTDSYVGTPLGVEGLRIVWR